MTNQITRITSATCKGPHKKYAKHLWTHRIKLEEFFIYKLIRLFTENELIRFASPSHNHESRLMLHQTSPRE